jgi:hypothetical protein
VPVHDFRAYASYDTDQLVSRLVEVVTELCGLAQEHAMIRVAERRAKAKAWQECEESAVSARDRYADQFALDLTCNVWEIQGDIRALEEEKWLLGYLLGVTDAPA